MIWWLSTINSQMIGDWPTNKKWKKLIDYQSSNDDFTFSISLINGVSQASVKFLHLPATENKETKAQREGNTKCEVSRAFLPAADKGPNRAIVFRRIHSSRGCFMYISETKTKNGMEVRFLLPQDRCEKRVLIANEIRITEGNQNSDSALCAEFVIEL